MYNTKRKKGPFWIFKCVLTLIYHSSYGYKRGFSIFVLVSVSLIFFLFFEQKLMQIVHFSRSSFTHAHHTTTYWLLRRRSDPCGCASCVPLGPRRRGTSCDRVDRRWRLVHRSKLHVAATDQYTVDRSQRVSDGQFRRTEPHAFGLTGTFTFFCSHLLVILYTEKKFWFQAPTTIRSYCFSNMLEFILRHCVF